MSPPSKWEGRRDKAQELVLALGRPVGWGILLDGVECCCTVVSASTETPTLMAAHEGAGSDPTCLSVLSLEALDSTPTFRTKRKHLNSILRHSRKWNRLCNYRSPDLGRMISHPGYSF